MLLVIKPTNEREIIRRGIKWKDGKIKRLRDYRDEKEDIYFRCTIIRFNFKNNQNVSFLIISIPILKFSKELFFKQIFLNFIFKIG